MDDVKKGFKELKVSDVKRKSGITYDKRMLAHSSDKKNHVECPERLESIIQKLSQTGLFNNQNLEVVDKVREATQAELALAHSVNYVDLVFNMWPEETSKKTAWLRDTYYNRDTPLSASLAAGAVLQSVEMINNGAWNTAFALVRPPGHHAGEKAHISGFCIFNNVAIAAQSLIKAKKMERIVIFDWDVHHGDGTQHIFYNSSQVLYASIHRYDKAVFYPGNSGDHKNVGEGSGKYYNINIPLNVKKSKPGNDEFLYLFERILMPIFTEFKPEFFFVSAGFDSALNDPLGQCAVTPDGYAYMLHRILELMKGRNVCLALEGGYNLDVIADCSESVVRILAGEKLPFDKSTLKKTVKEIMASIRPNYVGVKAAKKSIELLAPFWKSLETKELGELDKRCILNSGGLSDVIASYGVDKFQLEDEGKSLVKESRQGEVDFYRDLLKAKDIHSLDEAASTWRKFTVEIFSLEGTKIIMQNLTYLKEKHSIIQFKLGKTTLPLTEDPSKTDSIKKKDSGTGSSQFGFRVEGIIIKSNTGDIIEKKIGSEICWKTQKEADIKELLLKVLRKSDKPNSTILKKWIGFLADLIGFYEKTNNREIRGLSLIVLSNPNDESQDCGVFKLVSFKSYKKMPPGKRDENILFGLRNMKQILESL